MGGEEYCGGKWGGGGVGWSGVGYLKTYCCMSDFNLIPQFKYNTLLYCQVREILSIYRPTISFYENHQPDALG